MAADQSTELNAPSNRCVTDRVPDVVRRIDLSTKFVNITAPETSQKAAARVYLHECRAANTRTLPAGDIALCVGDR